MGLEDAFRDGPAFVPYLAAGDPDYESSLRYVEALDRGGADVIELGLPFSEPIAEGPTIQSAVVRSLEGGMTPERFLAFVRDLDVDAPLVCMTYYNLVYQYGDEPGPGPFVRAAADAGIEGFVVPDLPAEEAGPLREACTDAGVDLVFVVAPTTTDERLARILDLASGYLYVQARLGVTGVRDDVSEHTGAVLDRVAARDDRGIPKAVGFGIKTGEHAERIVAAGADGVIVGSALVDIVAEGVENGDDAATVADRLTAKARELVTGARRGAGLADPERT
ncbi:MAG: tryptophan synthase subunit alpha [Haloferacaceae archaeon]